MTAAVFIPYACTDPWREQAAVAVATQYRAMGLDVTIGGCDPPWRKAVAVANALDGSTADVLVVADADCLCDGVPAAIAAVEDGCAWAVPHDLVHRLDDVATLDVYQGTPPEATRGRAQRPYRGFAGGGIVVLSRTVWDTCPLDPRFEGWGSEDSSWAVALEALYGRPWRGTSDLYHLFHPPAPKQLHRWGNRDNRALEIRYRRAAHAGRRHVLDLLREAKAVPV